MERYFPEEQAISVSAGNNTAEVIRTIGEKFMHLNPPTPYTWRTFDETGIQADRKGRYLFNFDDRFPGAQLGERAVACGDLYCPAPKGSRFRVQCTCPAQVWLNGEKVFTSAGDKERSGEPDIFSVSLNQGLNRFVISAEKTAIGFSCSLQNAMPQWEPCNYIMPFAERHGEAGFLYRLCPAGSEFPPADALKGSREVNDWLPAKPVKELDEEGIFAALVSYESTADQIIPAFVSVFVDDHPATGALPAGTHTLRLYTTLKKLRSLRIRGLQPCLPVHGRCSKFLVMGPFDSIQDAVAAHVLPGRVAKYQGRELVWRPDLQHMALRPYVETFLFGKWTYPLGVTLYGMLESANVTGEEAFAKYVKDHVLQVSGIQEYAGYDTAKYGFAGVNQQLCWLDALDDCGSFGSLTLQFDPEGKNADITRLADQIAHYMTKEQPRTAEGAFCRRDDTIWADDMYMSVPFLTRYSKRSGDLSYMDFAAEQLLHFRELLFMPDKKLMAHMRCMIHGKNNGIPWSRGNGWVIFSLSELLLKLPEDHEKRPALISFLRELTEGYLSVQDPSGLWHQILDDPESYLESSATAMMICAFCRGIRNGWYDTALNSTLLTAAENAWNGLCNVAIDAEGNLYGVCRGSSFSFSRNYYRALSWNYNDTHGIGIVMLAGCELMKTRA